MLFLLVVEVQYSNIAFASSRVRGACQINEEKVIGVKKKFFGSEFDKYFSEYLNIITYGRVFSL